MLDKELLDKLLNLPEFDITDVKSDDNDLLISVEKKYSPTVCPSCGVCKPRLRVHSSRMQVIRDMNILGKRTGIHFNRKRYKCMECKATFYELSDNIPPQSRLTARLLNYIAIQSIKKPFMELEHELGVSNVTIREIFLEHVKHLKTYFTIETPKHLAIDEICIKKPRAVLCNGDKNTVIDMLPDRNKTTIIQYFKVLENPRNIKIVSQDMWRPYMDAVREVLPWAVIVVDKFHVVRMANDALDKYRKSLKESLGNRNITLKKDKYILLKREKSLTTTEIIFREAWFSEYPDLKKAYYLKESLFELYNATNKIEAYRLYDEWKSSIPSNLSMFNDVAKTIDNFRTEIFNYFDHRVTNAIAESLNSLIREIERKGRGYDFEVLRAKVLLSVNHKTEKISFGRDILHERSPNSFNLFSKITLNESRSSYKADKTIDYGVAFDELLKAINDGLM